MQKPLTLLIFCLTILMACAERGELGIVTSTIPVAHVERIFVATTRQRQTEVKFDFNGLRTSEVTYARSDMSLPPTHKVGALEWPKSTPNPATDFVVTDAQIFDTPTAFRSKVAGKDEAIVFIHGYNNNFAESLYRFAQISADMELESTSVLYAWPTTETSYEYLHDRDSVLFARDGLQILLEQLARSGVKRLVLVAHSIGANLLMETLRQMAISGDQRVRKIIDGVVLISPDIDPSVFQMQLNGLSPVPSPFVVFSTENDNALKVMSFLTGRPQRLGQITRSDQLAKHGVQVVNLSAFTDGDALNHMVALTSPSVISILKKLPAARELSKRNNGNPETILQRLFKQ